jgi:hypothetical protein
MDIHQARTEAIQEEIIAKRDAHHGRMEAIMNAWLKEMMACQEVTETCLEKAKTNPEKMKAGLEERRPRWISSMKGGTKWTAWIWRP